MRPTFWLVWREDGRAPTVKHATQIAALREAERLAREAGGSFHVLESVATMSQVVSVRREHHDPGAPAEAFERRVEPHILSQIDPGDIPATSIVRPADDEDVPF